MSADNASKNAFVILQNLASTKLLIDNRQDIG